MSTSESASSSPREPRAERTISLYDEVGLADIASMA